jgi:L-fuconolactonase
MPSTDAKGGMMAQSAIIDTHLHIWEPDQIHYPWLEDVPSLNRSFTLEDYDEASDGLNIESMVFVQCEANFAQFRDEAVWVAEEAKRNARIKGMVAWAPLEKGDAVREDLEALQEHSILRGIRRIIQFEPDLDFCLRPDFVRGVQLLSEYDLSFDICIDHRHLPNTIKFVRRCPEVRFILNHFGKPDIRNGAFGSWRTHLSELASFPNVHCKVSGLTTEAHHDRWTKEELKPYIDYAVEVFGFERLIYGGDWPVCTQATTLPRWVATLDWALSGISADEQERLYRTNAKAFYRIDE